VKFESQDVENEPSVSDPSENNSDKANSVNFGDLRQPFPLKSSLKKSNINLH